MKSSPARNLKWREGEREKRERERERELPRLSSEVLSKLTHCTPVGH